MKLKNAILLFLTALIWGIAFVSQSKGGDIIGPLSFNSIRSLMGAAVLIPVIKIIDKSNNNKNKPKTKEDRKALIIAGVGCGTALCIASNLQQLGINYGTSAGKAGFITSCYILLVPILSLFIGKKAKLNIWIGVLIAVAGLYLLCMNESFSVQNSDLLVLICALCFSVQILLVDKYVEKVDGVRLSCLQFFITGVITFIPMCVIEIPQAGGIRQWLNLFTTWDAWIPLLYSGIMSCGVAYTFQILGQKGADATIASLIMSLEAVFSVLAGMIILHEMLSGREIAGCILLFIAIVIAQINFKSIFISKKKL